MLGTDDNRTDHCWLMLCSIFLPSISLFFGRLKQRPLKGSVYFLSRSQSFNLGWYHKYLISLSSKKKNLISLIYFFIFFAYGGFSNSLSLSLSARWSIWLKSWLLKIELHSSELFKRVSFYVLLLNYLFQWLWAEPCMENFKIRSFTLIVWF